MLKLMKRLIPIMGFVLLIGACKAPEMQPLNTSTDPQVLYADNAVHLIYVGADNCPYCRDWEAWALPEYSATNVAKKAYFTWIRADRFQDTGRDEYWPEHARWVRDELKISRGTPRYIVLKGREIQMYKSGTGSWKREVLPLLSQLTY